MKREPVAVVNSVTALIEAIISCAVGFGLDWTPEQVGLVMAVVIAAGGVIQTLIARSMVSPIGRRS